MPNIENTLKTRIQNDQAGTFVVIVPTDSDRLKRQRELVEYHPNKAVANLRVYTSVNFVQQLYNQVQPVKCHISQGLQNLWFHEIANPQSGNSDAYRYEAFRPDQNISVPDSTLSLIVDTINRLRERGETAQSIVDTINRLRERDETAQNITADNPTLADLVHIYKDYEARLEDRWIDEQGRHSHLANHFDPRFMRNAFPRVNLVVVEGFTVLSEADIKILTRIAQMPNIELWFRTDCVSKNEALYKNIMGLVQEFKDVGAGIDADYERDPDRHRHFAENLFQTDAVNATANCNSDTETQIKLLKPADRSEEVEQIAHRIQKYVLDDGCKLSDICVAYYNIGQYQQRIAEIFPAYGIPYSLVESIPLTKSEVVKAIFSRLSAHPDTLSDAYFSDDIEPASHTRLLHPSKFQEYVDGLLKKGRVLQHILNPMLGKKREIVEGEIEAYRQFNRIVKELCSVLMSEGERAFFLDDYIEKLHHIARHTNYRNRAVTKGDTVKIAQLGELRSLEFKTVFLGDFVESRFPENYRPDPLLPEIPYRNEEEQLHDNRFMFYRVLKAFRERLYLLTPQREDEADLIPSLFLEQLKAVADVEEIEIADPAQGSVPGFLGKYGNHLWTTPTPFNGRFPAEIAEMRSLINHVVEVENSREETHKHLAYEGVLTAGKLSDGSKKRLKSRQQRTYSVTELETYAKCPFQYFTSQVLNVRVDEDEVEDELSSLEKGKLLHNVLFRFYNNRREQQSPPIGQCSDNDFEEAKRQLDTVLENASEEYRHQRTEPPIAKDNLFWGTDVGKLRVALHKWLEAECTYDLPVIPHFFEVNFGQSGEPADSRLSSKEPICVGDVRMKGKIDRIDIDNGTFSVVDYKTGSSTIRMPEILNGRSLQLPIYLQIAEKLLEKHNRTGLEPAAGPYYKIRLDQFAAELGIGKKSLNGLAFKDYRNGNWTQVSSRSGQLLDDEYFVNMLTRVSGYVQQYVDSISNGNFPLITRVKTFSVSEDESEEANLVETNEYGFVDAEEHGDKPITPRNKTQPCNYCDYKRVCRVGAIAEATQSDD